MSDFAPSVEAAKKALGSNLAIDARPHPPGAAGVKFSLDEVARRAKAGRNDPRVRSWAIRAIHDAGGPQDQRRQAEAILAALKKATVYVQDPLNSEFMQAAAQTLCLDDKGLCFKGGDCFPKGTLVLRDDFELIAIEDIKVGERIWGYDKWTTVKSTKYKGRLQVDAIFCNNGSVVQLTGDHKVYVAVCNKRHTYQCCCRLEDRTIERITVSCLVDSDVLIAPSKLPFGSDDMDPRRALIEGWYVSDGWSEDYRFSISGQDGQPKEKQKREVQTICAELGIPTHWKRKSITIKDPEWTQRVHQMGWYAPEKHFLSLNLNEAAAAASLRGVMADSGKNTNGNGRTFTTTSRLLAIQTRVLHRMFGMSGYTSYIIDHGGLGSNPIWRLNIRDTQAKRREKLLRVKRIERDIGTFQCYDIETSDHYVYLPEHDVTVSNCDDVTIAYAAATLSVGIPTKIVGQSFNNSGVPQHVIAAIQDPISKEWLRVDPSTNKPVGEYVMASQEWWVDPMDVNDKGSSTIAGSGDFVGVGHLGDVPVPASLYDTVTQQVKATVFALSSAANDLNAALSQLDQIKAVTGYDPEPAGTAIVGLADFPIGGAIWTASMDKVAKDILSQADFLSQAGTDALNGARTIWVDQTSNDILIGAHPNDPYSWKVVLATGTDAIIGIFNPFGILLVGVTLLLGDVLTPDEVHAQVLAAPTGTIQGVPEEGRLGAFPVVAVVVGVVAVVATVAIYLAYSKYCAIATAAATEATMNSLVGVAEKLFPGQPDKQAAWLTDQRNSINAAQKQNNADNPFSGTIDSLSSLVMWGVIGAAVVGGVIVALPLLKEGAAAAADAIHAKRMGHGGMA